MSSTVHSTDEDHETKEMDIRSLSSSRRQPQNAPHIHKVGVPPKQNFLKEFKATVKETLFADDPLRPFKDQPGSKSSSWACKQSSPSLNGDIGYAKLANLDPQYGLYSSFVPPLIYAFMGSSRDIAIGPVAVVSLLLGTLLQNEVDSKKDAEAYRRLAFTATFFAGITQATLGVFRLGFLIDFLSHAAVVGFMGGAAITIALQQLKGLFGIQNFTKKTDIVSVLHSVFGSAHHGWNWQTIVIGVSFLAFLIFAKYIVRKKNKKFFWVPAIAPLISVILSTFFVFITRADKHGVQIVKHIEKGINPSSVKEIYFSGEFLLKGFRIGVVAGMIGLTEAIAIGRTFASMKDYQLDGNKEMVALGTMNVVGSMTSCYVATAVVGLVDFEAAILIWKIDKFDFIACMGAFFGVVFSSVEIGLLIAVSISFAKILLQVTRPRTAILGKLPGTNAYRNIQQYPGATKVQSVLIVRVDSAIYFSNSNYIKERSFSMSVAQLILANPGPVVIDKLHASNFATTIGEDKIFLTVADAVASCSPKLVTEV
ncbi:hypothetical protein GH714_024663 [Hevea brasiliensis]|uniref:SLC26A/SulP transporter domain-containing protein n=1 Tax=Hevea brasiliensis TaxID=3981 RepID=A0A6A6KTI3_HEVBR|nr:hypothetical protein GH714_024663 [Hevea brasiliensis]